MKKYLFLLFVLLISLPSCNRLNYSNSNNIVSSSSSSQNYDVIKSKMEIDGNLTGTNHLINKFKNQETFIVVFEGKDCSFCHSFNKNVLDVYLNSNMGKEYQDDIYYYYSTDFVSYIIEISQNYGIQTAKMALSSYENDLMLEYYIPAYEEFEGYTYNTKVHLSDTSAFYVAETPTTLYVVNGEVMGFLYGDISGLSNYLLRFSETIEAWSLAKNDFEKGKERFHEVLASMV